MKAVKKLTSVQKAYRTLYFKHGTDRGASFLANVIMNGCSKPTTKLHNLIKLLDKGIQVQCAQFDMFTITVDGERHPLSYLDKSA